MPPSVVKLVSGQTVFFLCDVQTRFRHAIFGFSDVVNTINKMLKVAGILQIPVIVTEQNSKALGRTVDEIDLSSLGPLHLITAEKTLFSMVTPEVKEVLAKHSDIKSVVLFGIETHVCVLQTAIDLLESGYEVHILADGVSSCNKEEVPFALARIRQAGGQITTSESAVFQLLRDSSLPNFRKVSAIIKEESERTKEAVGSLLHYRSVL